MIALATIFLLLLLTPFFIRHQRPLIIYAVCVGGFFVACWVSDFIACSQPGSCGGFDDVIGRAVFGLLTLGFVLGFGFKYLLIWICAGFSNTGDD